MAADSVAAGAAGEEEAWVKELAKSILATPTGLVGCRRPNFCSAPVIASAAGAAVVAAAALLADAGTALQSAFLLACALSFACTTRHTSWNSFKDIGNWLTSNGIC